MTVASLIDSEAGTDRSSSLSTASRQQAGRRRGSARRILRTGVCECQGFSESSRLRIPITFLPLDGGLRYIWKDIVPGAQTERRGGAGPAGACLAVRTRRPLKNLVRGLV